MKNKYVFVTVLLLVLLLTGAGLTQLYVKEETKQQDSELTVVTSFYPMYIAAMNVIGDTPGVDLQNLSEPQTGCLHDYQLTPCRCVYCKWWRNRIFFIGCGSRL